MRENFCNFPSNERHYALFNFGTERVDFTEKRFLFHALSRIFRQIIFANLLPCWYVNEMHLRNWRSGTIGFAPFSISITAIYLEATNFDLTYL